MEECRAKLAEAMEAQKVSEGVITGLKEEVAQKTEEIKQLKHDIQERDKLMTKLTNESRARVEEVVKDAEERVDRIGAQARERSEADQAALEAAKRQVTDLEAAAHRAEEVEVASQVQFEEDNRMQIEEVSIC